MGIPHGRIKGLKNPLAAVIRVQQPVPFDAPDDEPVGLLIFLLVPEAATQPKITSSISAGAGARDDDGLSPGAHFGVE